MSSPTAVSTVWSAQRSEFIAAKMFNTCPTMPAPAKDPDLVNKIAFFQNKNIRGSKIGSYEGEMISKLQVHKKSEWKLI